MPSDAQRLALLIRRLQDLDQYAYPDGPRVIVNGDDWQGQLVVKWDDVMQIVRDTEQPPSDGTVVRRALHREGD